MCVDLLNVTIIAGRLNASVHSEIGNYFRLWDLGWPRQKEL